MWILLKENSKATLPLKNGLHIVQRHSESHSEALTSLAKQKIIKLCKDHPPTASTKLWNSAICRCCLTETKLETFHVQDFKK